MRKRTIVEILAAIAMTERVGAFLASYDERDAAIDQLIDDVLLSRRQLVGELRERAHRPSAPLFAHSPA